MPWNWKAWTLDKRRDFWAGTAHGELNLVPRDSVCVAEIWCEALGGQIRDLKKSEAREINAVLDRMEGWERAASPKAHGPYKMQRGFVRRKDDE